MAPKQPEPAPALPFKPHMEQKDIYDESSGEKVLTRHEIIWRTGKRLVIGRAPAGEDAKLGLFSTDLTGNWRFHLDQASSWRPKIFGGGEKDYLIVRRVDPRENAVTIQNRGVLAVKILLRSDKGEVKTYSVDAGKEFTIPGDQIKVFKIGDLPAIQVHFDK